jgi:CYTH domain-containing protein
MRGMGAAYPTNENTVIPAGKLDKYSCLERERRFLLAELPLPRNSPHTQIWDNYLPDTNLRLRKMRAPERDEYTLKLTKKQPLAPDDFARCHITNLYLSADEYNHFAPLFAGGREIRKNRYPFEFAGRKFGIDFFLGPLWGLILTETEFASDEEMDAFAPPSFAVREVTAEENFTSGRLCRLTVEDLNLVTLLGIVSAAKRP